MSAQKQAKELTPLVPPGSAPGTSRTLLPNDHLRMLIELIRPATPDLARRWLASLLNAPEEEREEIVRAIEAKMRETYDDAERERAERRQWLHVSGPEVQKDGYTERVERTYEVKPDEEDARSREAG